MVLAHRPGHATGDQGALLSRLGVGFLVLFGALSAACNPWRVPSVVLRHGDIDNYDGAYRDDAFLFQPGMIKDWGAIPLRMENDVAGQPTRMAGLLVTRGGRAEGVEVPPAVIAVDVVTGALVEVLEIRDAGDGPGFGHLWWSGGRGETAEAITVSSPFAEPYSPYGWPNEGGWGCFSPNVDDCPAEESSCHCFRSLRFDGPPSLQTIDWRCDRED